MLYEREEFEKLNPALGLGKVVAFDFETTGLYPHKGDKAFILGFAFDSIVGSVRLTDGIDLSHFFGQKEVAYCAHNAKFEMGFLERQFGVSIEGTVWDTEVMAKLYNNNHDSYSLQECAKRIGASKHVPMLEWLKDRKNKKAYHLAPESLIVPYVEQDANLSLLLYHNQHASLKPWLNGHPPINLLLKLEPATTKNLYRIESGGVKLDADYCRRALAHEREREHAACTLFEQQTGAKLIMSAKQLKPIFDAHGLAYGRTEKGNASFDGASLERSKDHPIVKTILMYRDAQKRASTYWENFLDEQVSGQLYPNIRQCGAATGRMSVTNPACQTWPNDDADHPFPIRRAFVAEGGCQLVSMDYAQMELRVMAHEAGETTMLDAIRLGRDFHSEVSQSAGVTRDVAKRARFAKLYGAGRKKIAETLGILIEDARKVCDALDAQTPKITAYAYRLIRDADQWGWSSNVFGRRYQFDRDFSYKAPNYRIQGGCSDVLRIAIAHCWKIIDEHAESNRTRIVMPIHDELVFQVDACDMHLLPMFRRAMIEAYLPDKKLMDVSISLGHNLCDLENYVEESRD